MSAFWSGWVKFLVVLNLGITFFLFVWAQRVRIPTLPDGTTGHTWAHGVLREGVRTLPRWWVLLSLGMFVVGATYLVLYPGFGNFKGMLDWTSTAELQRATSANEAKLQAANRPLQSLPIAALAEHPNATAQGQRLYLDNCAACHGSAARGNHALGAPDLTDDDWLYGDSSDAIMTSILDGRRGVMPAWSAALGRDGVSAVTAYVLSLGGYSAPQDWTIAGKAHFDAMCVACHGADGRGNAVLGAPNLTDDAWLYGGDFASIAESVRDGRHGVMPAWRDRLDENEARMIAAWLHTQRRPET
jgi:cytochrome c oxidase cbb3-type subunit 3